MQRLKDYAGFGMWFLGLGYIVMWLVTGPLNWPLGRHALALCAGANGSAFCALAHPQTLPLPVHIVGFLAALAVLVRLLLIAVRSTRRAPEQSGPPHPTLRTRRREPAPTVNRVKARDHFGLRGIER